MPVEVIGIDHIYLAVRSLERSEAFYDRVMLQVLGYRKAHSAIAGDPHVHYFNRQFGFSLRRALAGSRLPKGPPRHRRRSARALLQPPVRLLAAPGARRRA